MIGDVVLVILHTLAAIVAAAILVLGFAFVIFLGDAHARGRPLLRSGFDWVAALVAYLSWFGLLWLFGFSTLLLMVACGAAVALCVIYAASYQAAASRRIRPDAPALPHS